MITRRQTLVGALPLLAARPARAGRNVTLLVGAAEGSASDVMARNFAPHLARHLPDTAIQVRNLPGEGGLKAYKALADTSPGDGVLGWVATPTLAARMVDRSADSLLQSLVLLGAVQREPVAFVASIANPLDSVQDIIQRAGTDADSVPLGTPQAGSPPHLAALRLQVLAQTRLNIVTFPSAAAARQAVLAGNVSAAALGLSDVVQALRDNLLVGLGIAASRRAGLFPDLPILNEAGLALSATIRRGLAAPAQLPPELAHRFSEALRAVAADTDFSDMAEEKGVLVAWMDTAAWTALLLQEKAELATLWQTEPWLNTGSG